MRWLRSVCRFTSLGRRVPGFVSDEGRGHPPPLDLKCSPELELWLRLMGDGPDDQDARIPKSIRRYYIAQQGVFADAGVHPPADCSPIEWYAGPLKPP